MNLGTRGGKARTPGPSETPEFCAAWEAKRAAGETKGMTGSREHYARAFAWGQAEGAGRLWQFEEWLADRAGPLLHIDDVRDALHKDKP